MTQRERQPSAGATLAPRPASAPPRAGGSANAGERSVPTWEDLYRSLSPAQQSELLALASQQGLLYAHQLPEPDPTSLRDSSGSRPGGASPRSFLPQLLAGKTDLAPVYAPPIEDT